MKKLMLVLALLTMVAAACGGGTGSSGGYKSSYQVTYQVTTNSPAGFDVTLSNATGDTEQHSGPFASYEKTYTMSPGAFVYIASQLQGSGTITCRIIVDGAEVKKVTSDGEYVIATCSGKL